MRETRNERMTLGLELTVTYYNSVREIFNKINV